ncbi:CPBP family intramembrane metalloprotease [Chryseobacterium sp. SSA4.19]|uniref:CPBP family intramembrane glutamic endopeptidase n=1 Tax=Chryseobacterium sp. SSA4.19 TaxID=2919915 RepID=UPI001F4EA029|nr:CPBP family intramembrane glutamic endopeptidase [Chryseobacterium sp. SSA4.19]MCJ8154876.1 CPBP family intramembrane metalloprotease [Chryseobacterium sp. SSA4.19]
MSLNGKYSLGILLTFVLLTLVMLYAIPVINTMMGTAGITSEKFFYTRLALWVVLILIFLYTFFVEKQSFLLWKERKYPIAFYLATITKMYFTCLIGGGFLSALVQMLTHEKFSNTLLNLILIFKNNYALIVWTCITAGVVEEFLMRGYIQPRLEKIYHNPYFGIIISAVLFGMLHSTYGTVAQVLIPFFIGVVFAAFYKFYSNIKILIICHFMYDFISLMLMNFIHFKSISAL